MHYLLYYDSEILNSYGTIELLRLGILIIIYRLFIAKKFNKEKYLKLKEKLIVCPFTIEKFNDREFNQMLVDIDIKIESVHFTEKASNVLDSLKENFNNRIEKLKAILDRDIRIKVTVPGENSYKHRLGTMYRDDWQLVDNIDYKSLADMFHEFITEQLLDLVKGYGERITFGDVTYQNASSLNYNLWSANAINYNLRDGEEIPGDYQANEMKIEGEGVYGLIVTPRYGY